MTTLTAQIPDSLAREVEELASREHGQIDPLVAIALAREWPAGKPGIPSNKGHGAAKLKRSGRLLTAFQSGRLLRATKPEECN